MIRDANSIHIVIDIETLGTVDSLLRLGGCPILEAAFSVVQYINGKFDIAYSESATFNLKEQLTKRQCIDEDMVKWHKNHNPNYILQSKRSRNESIAHPFHFESSLKYICARAGFRYQNVHFWAKDKDFDFIILRAYAMQFGAEYPFLKGVHRSRIHCLRDLIYFSGFDEISIKNPNPNDALSDAITEAKILVAILNQE